MANIIVTIIFQISDATPKLDGSLGYLTYLIFSCLVLGAYLFCDLVYCLVGSTRGTSFKFNSYMLQVYGDSGPNGVHVVSIQVTIVYEAEVEHVLQDEIVMAILMLFPELKRNQKLVQLPHVQVNIQILTELENGRPLTFA